MNCIKKGAKKEGTHIRRKPYACQLKMKGIFIVVVLLIGCSSAKPNPAKRSLTCSGFPKQLSGRLYMAEVDESGLSETVDISFNLDLNLQRMQEETADGVLIMDFKAGTLYATGPEGCYTEPLAGEKIMPEQLEDMPLKLVATGSLGANGASVDCYSFQDDEEGVGFVTLESGDQCIPVDIALKSNYSATVMSFLDLKTTVQPEKLKIPDECKQAAITRRSVEDMIETSNMRKTKRAFPLFLASRASLKRRGFPWLWTKQQKKKNSKGK